VPDDGFTTDEIAHYRRDGWVLVRGLLGSRSVAACKHALSDLATGAIPARTTTLMYEYGQQPIPGLSSACGPL
jgi:hypothetical protein